MAIVIGVAKSWRGPEDWKFTPDDRMQIIETDNGNVIHDYGHISSGDKMTFSCVFEREEFVKVYNYWHNRELVNFTDTAGNIWENIRVKIISYGYEQHFENYINAELEIWRI